MSKDFSQGGLCSSGRVCFSQIYSWPFSTVPGPMLECWWHILRSGTEQGCHLASSALLGTMGDGRTGFQVSYPGNKAVSHILRQLLVLLQLFEEDAVRGEKGWVRHLCTADPFSTPEDCAEANTTSQTLCSLHMAFPLSDNVVKSSFKYVGTHFIKMYVNWLISAT